MRLAPNHKLSFKPMGIVCSCWERLASSTGQAFSSVINHCQTASVHVVPYAGSCSSHRSPSAKQLESISRSLCGRAVAYFSVLSATNLRE
jgi:hypothetical protein